jgi:UMF1 family MFS transporter
MFDFANSGYTTVVLTAVFNTYFVSVIAGHVADGGATLLWTIAISLSNLIILFVGPWLGAIADHTARKKTFLIVTTVGCIVFTCSLSSVGPGDVILAMALVCLSNLMFAAGENLIAAFLPEIAKPEDMGRISAYGWSLGYLGGLLVLGVCLAWVMLAQERGYSAEMYIPVVMWIVALVFGVAALPTFLILKERATPVVGSHNAFQDLQAGWRRIGQTLSRMHHYKDLFRFLASLTVYNCGIYTVIVLAAVYAQAAMGFSTRDTMLLILVVNITAAAGAFGFGLIHDRLGSVRTLVLTLSLWVIAILIAYAAKTAFVFWISANLVGIAMGSSQSAGRALVGYFTPADRQGEFFGLWGVALKLSAIIGPLTYGLTTRLLEGDHRTAILSTLCFFVTGLVLLLFVDEKRGRYAAMEQSMNTPR